MAATLADDGPIDRVSRIVEGVEGVIRKADHALRYSVQRLAQIRNVSRLISMRRRNHGTRRWLLGLINGLLSQLALFLELRAFGSATMTPSDARALVARRLQPDDPLPRLMAVRLVRAANAPNRPLSVVRLA